MTARRATLWGKLNRTSGTKTQSLEQAKFRRSFLRDQKFFLPRCETKLHDSTCYQTKKNNIGAST